MSDGDIIAIVTGVAALISAVAGVILAVRAARSKERAAAADEVGQLTAMLETERHDRIAAELDRHQLRLRLAENGIDPDSDDA
jgi:hypothetical protein